MSGFLDTLMNTPQTLGVPLMFYVFATVLLFSGLMVIVSRNPVHSVLFLILAFFNAAGLFLLLGAEFLAATLIIVYVGAVAVLFLFVVMMLDINFQSIKREAKIQLPIGLLLAGILTAEMALLMVSWSFSPSSTLVNAAPAGFGAINTEAIGKVLYTTYILPFETAGLVLLVAMIGAIVLTHRKLPGIRRQSIKAQVSRRASDVLKVNQVKSGEGV